LSNKLPDWVYNLSEEVLIESIKYPTVLGESYKEIIEYYSEVLKRYGVHVTIHRVPDEYIAENLTKEYNPDKPRYILLARIGRGDRVLQFNGHYDVVSPGEGWTVTDPFKPKKVDDKIYGRGSTDMKGGIASFIAAIAYLAGREDLDIVIEAAIVPDEEIGGLTGTGYLVNELKSRPNWVVIAEPSGLDRIWIGHKGLVWGYVKTYGRQVHGSTPWLGDNAFEKLVKVALYFFEKYIPMLKNKKSKYDYDLEGGEYPTATLGGKLLSPGNINILPGTSGFSIDRRLIVEEKTDDVIKEINEFLEKVSRELGIKTDFTVIQKMEPALTEPDTDFVNTLVNVIKEDLGLEPRRTICVGGLDLRYYTNVGVEAISYGPGEPELPHKVDEYIRVENLHGVIDVYVDLALRLSKKT